MNAVHRAGAPIPAGLVAAPRCDFVYCYGCLIHPYTWESLGPEEWEGSFCRIPTGPPLEDVLLESIRGFTLE